MRTLKEIVAGAWVAMMTGAYLLFLFISIIVFSLIILLKKILTWKWVGVTLFSNMKKQRKPGSGRKKGSYSFCNVTLKSMNELFGEKMKIKVSRKWAVEVGLVGADATAVPENSKTKVNLKVTEFEDDEKVNLEVKETEW